MTDTKRTIDPTRSIFFQGFKCPEYVTIVAPGYNAHDRMGLVALDSYRIAVNYGITMPVKSDCWIVADWHGIKRAWWKRADTGYHGFRIFSIGMAERCDVWDDATGLVFDFVHRRKVERSYKEERPGLKDLFRPDETTVGIAIDLACRFGAKKIDLLGVDMQGKLYYDGSESTCESCDRSDVWIFRDMLMDVIEWNQAEFGVEFRSLSETALPIETIQGDQ